MSRPVDCSPHKLYNILSQSVIGQDEYLKVLANTIWLHHKRIEARILCSNITNIPKHNLLCVGPTGSGKTMAVSILAELYGLDVCICNAAEITGAGWKGKEASEIISELYVQCNKDKTRAERAIVILDEVDKMLLQRRGSEPSFAAENVFLKLIEGTEVSISTGKMDTEKEVISTRDILFIASGAFDGIEEIVRKRLSGEKVIGFRVAGKMEDIQNDLYSQVTRKDLQDFGVGRQFLGRFSQLATLRRLEISDLEQIILKSKASIVNQMDTMLAITNNVHVTIDRAGARVLARKAYEQNTGARGLSQLLIQAMNNVLFDLDQDEVELRTIAITANPAGEICTHLIASENDMSYLWLDPVVITCEAERKDVEQFCHLIVRKSPDLCASKHSNIMAAHALLCSLVFYLLLTCDKEDHTMAALMKLLDLVKPIENHVFEECGSSVFLADLATDYAFYYGRFMQLDPGFQSVKLAERALITFAEETKREAYLRQCMLQIGINE